MKKILVISASHGHMTNVKKVLKKEAPFDLLLHLGDLQGDEEGIGKLISCPMIAVCGNCDYFSPFPSEKLIRIGGHKILLTHGNRHFVSLGTGFLRDAALENGCDTVIFGHTHVPLVDLTDPDVMILNPGSITYPRQQGREPSYMTIMVREDGRLSPEVFFL